jgi:hypothetical protein
MHPVLALSMSNSFLLMLLAALLLVAWIWFGIWPFNSTIFNEHGGPESKWFCNRCRAEVSVETGKCKCTESPSPWVPVGERVWEINK